MAVPQVVSRQRRIVDVLRVLPWQVFPISDACGALLSCLAKFKLFKSLTTQAGYFRSTDGILMAMYGVGAFVAGVRLSPAPWSFMFWCAATVVALIVATVGTLPLPGAVWLERRGVLLVDGGGACVTTVSLVAWNASCNRRSVHNGIITCIRSLVAS